MCCSCAGPPSLFNKYVLIEEGYTTSARFNMPRCVKNSMFKLEYKTGSKQVICGVVKALLHYSLTDWYLSLNILALCFVRKKFKYGNSLQLYYKTQRDSKTIKEKNIYIITKTSIIASCREDAPFTISASYTHQITTAVSSCRRPPHETQW